MTYFLPTALKQFDHQVVNEFDFCPANIFSVTSTGNPMKSLSCQRHGALVGRDLQCEPLLVTTVDTSDAGILAVTEPRLLEAWLPSRCSLFTLLIGHLAK